MLLRRVVPTALATAAICACEPGVGYDAARNPQQTNYAVFDPAALPPQIPIPNDQAVPFSIDLVKIVVDASGTQVRSKPDLDLSSIRICNGTNPNCNVAVMKVPPSTPLFVTDIDQPPATDYVTSGDHGTLNIRRTPRDTPTGAKTRTWDPGVQYVAAIRGGPNGVTANGGQPIYPQPAMYIIEQGKDLTKPENQGLIPGDTAAQRQATALQLEALRNKYEGTQTLPGPFVLLSA